MRVPAPTLTFFQHAVGTDLDGVGQFDLALEDAADVDGNVAPVAQLATDVDARRSARRTPATSSWSAILLVLAFQFGELDLAVDAEHLPFAFRLRGAHRQAFADGQGDDVGQVVLAWALSFSACPASGRDAPSA